MATLRHQRPMSRIRRGYLLPVDRLKGKQLENGDFFTLPLLIQFMGYSPEPLRSAVTAVPGCVWYPS